VKAASCLAACVLAIGLAAASGATQPIKVPAGYRVEVFATGLNRPTAMAFGPGGALYLTQETGEVVRIRRGSRRPQVVLRGFRIPLGLTWHRGRLFVSAQGAIWRVNAGQRRRSSATCRSGAISRTTSSSTGAASTSAAARRAMSARSPAG
jgi:glucose/arabinose dehydrogenase